MMLEGLVKVEYRDAKSVFFGCPPEHGHGNVPRYHEVDRDKDDSMVCDIYVGVEDEGVLVGRGRSHGMCALACLYQVV